MGVRRNHWRRHSRHVIDSKRWRAIRFAALRRDNWCCQECGGPGREVDHILPVRTHPELAYDLANLQTLCASCHAKKTISEIGLSPLTPERRAWRDLVKGKELRCWNP